ncbi:hypothetical protein CDL12_06062 [Handroanthus impetiginosus]|uniref:Uncharacterized protein n=1 Tax=Handroanthus impetiginosus TaxID=429701 RepID=A0A2G9HUN7_9LAMI|nr:hypothetical protein CDL12_06062 [Handroanthus impetiginosus]
MASNTLPTGDIARRNKDSKQPNADAPIDYNGKTAQRSENNALMVLHNQENGASYQNPHFSVALHDLMGIDSNHTVVDESTTTNTTAAATAVGPHFSNASSLVTSLSSSREGSPDKYGAPVLFARPSSWIPTAH